MRNRVFMNINYFLLLLWLAIIYLSYSHPFFAFLFSTVHVFLMFYFLVYGLYLLFAAKSKQKFISIVFFLPFAIFIILPLLREEFHLITSIPDDKLIKEYIMSQHVGKVEILDTSITIADYDSDNKNLNLRLKIMPNIFIMDQSNLYSELKINQKTSARIMMNVMYLNFIDLPENVSKVTKIPNRITAYGYWGDKLIMKANFEKNRNKYKLVQPYPFVSLLGSVNNLQLQYELDNRKGSIELVVDNFPNTNFQINLLKENLD
jgi:hypothetical protein